jgi:serine/threonine protein kinase
MSAAKSEKMPDSKPQFILPQKGKTIFMFSPLARKKHLFMAEVVPPLPCLRVLRKVGEGSFGQVFEALWRDQHASAEKRAALKRVAVRGTSGNTHYTVLRLTCAAL